MKLTQIRNATIRMIYAGNVFLIDPWLAPKHQLSFVDIPGRPFHVPDPVKENIPMPFYGLPMDTEQILSGVDYYIVTHLHPDHIDIAKDGTVGGPLNKQTPVICQSTEDAKILQYSKMTEEEKQKRMEISKIGAQKAAEICSKPIICDGVIFPSMNAAANTIGLNRSTIRRRIKSTNNKFANWSYMD